MNKLVNKMEYDRLMRKYVSGISHHDLKFERDILTYRNNQLEYLKENPINSGAKSFKNAYLENINFKNYYATRSRQKPIVKGLIAYAENREHILMCLGKMPLSAEINYSLSECNSLMKEKIMNDLSVDSYCYDRALASMKYSRKFLELGHNINFEHIIEE
jgi:hypothetical protein